ncbi:MAG: DNA methyltransferase, partial [Pirellulales bacterium]
VVEAETTSDSGSSDSTSSDSSSSDASTAATAVAAPARASRPSGGGERTADDFRREAEKLAAATLVNRLVMLRLLEAPSPDGRPAMRSPAVVTGGWDSRGYKDFRALAPALVRGDATEGFEFLLRLVYADLAMELPGLYGDAGVADLVPIPPATLRHAIESLDNARLESCWTDDMTLGWVYQYWNDPEREALDAKINAGGKIEPHEIASKTQLFTERYMVDWLLQNSLGPMWLAICKKHGWTPEVEADGTLANLEARRVEWRAARDSGKVSLTDLMPLHTFSERAWAYYVPQPLSDDAVAKAAGSVRDLKIIDPAVGSGHFLVVAVGLLWALYREEARHRGKADDPEWSDSRVVERILEYNLHGIDIDPRAVQIAAAALLCAGRQISRDARPSRLNLVAANLRLASLPDDDPSLVKLRAEVERDIGMPGDLVDSIIHALRGADSLGSLLRIDRALDDAIAQHEKAMQDRPAEFQKGLFGDEPKPARQARIEFDATAARRSLLDRLESFLSGHTGS